MYNELTQTDIDKMQAELDDRIINQRPELIEEVKRTRAFGDLSENYEYKAAKQAKNRNDSRVRYLQNMIKTATLIEDCSGGDEVGLFDQVTLYLPEDDETLEVRVCTTVRVSPGSGYISKESPLGIAILGKKTGDRVTVQVNEQYGYDAVIQHIEKSEDDGSAPLLSY
ncbi:MAG: GreA/GreB family elongation factor [Oscillospiraceae bacterium]|nr:GreA/GreB family elongation factor [Oscillospiraceae bacterium]